MRTDIWTIEQEYLAKQYAHASSLEFIEKVGKTKAAANSHFYYSRYIQKTTKKQRKEHQCKRRSRQAVVISNAPNRKMIEDAKQRLIAVRSLTAIICGDPPPGYSALDRLHK